MGVNIQNSGPVSVDYSSRDEAVPISFFYKSSLHWVPLIIPIQVTIEIETNPPRAKEGVTKAEDSDEEEKAKVAQSFQIPGELLD